MLVIFLNLKSRLRCLLLFKAYGSFIADLFSDTHTVSLNSQWVGVAKEVNNKIVLALI